MKKIVSIMLCVLMLAAMASLAFVNAEEAFTILNVKEGQCTLIDNPDTNDQAAGYALCFAEAYGTGRTTQGDIVKFENVDFGTGVTNIAVRCGFNNGEKEGDSTEFWVYIDDEKCEGEPVAKFSVSESETASSQIVDQVYKNQDVAKIEGVHNVFVKGETAYSGSFSQIILTYEGNKFDEAAVKAVADKEAKIAEIALRTEIGDTDYVICTVASGKCELIDNPDTNDQAAGNALCFAEAYGTGRTTQGDIVKFTGVDFGDEGVTNVAVKCGYHLGGDKEGTGTEFWVYIDDEKCEGEPIAKFAVNDSETKSSQIVDQVYKNADIDALTGVHDVYVKGETEYSGSFSKVVFTKAGNSFDEDFVEAQANAEVALEIKKLEEELAAEEEAKKAEEEAKKAEEEAKNAEAEEPAEEPAPEETEEPTVEEEAPAESSGNNAIVWIVIVIVVIAVIVVAVVFSKKKKN